MHCNTNDITDMSLSTYLRIEDYSRYASAFAANWRAGGMPGTTALRNDDKAHFLFGMMITYFELQRRTNVKMRRTKASEALHFFSQFTYFELGIPADGEHMRPRRRRECIFNEAVLSSASRLIALSSNFFIFAVSNCETVFPKAF